MPVPYVGIDNEAAACDAVRYLVQQGRRRIAFVTSDERYMYARLRRQGYLRALREAGIEPLQDGVVVTSGVRFEDGRRVEAYLRDANPRPDAIFCVSDTLGIAAVHGAGGIGMRVPDDLAVIGFDDIAAATMIRPELTTVRQPMRELGATAVNLLLKRLRNPRSPVSGVVLPHELVIRGSA
jgi:DNA-binding LacI/PurR family transcriptional regulator